MKPTWNWLERGVFTLSALLVAAVLGLLTLETWIMGDTPPDLVVSVGTPLEGSGHWRVPVSVENHGSQTAEEVRLEVQLRHAGEVLERAELTLSYVPRRSRRAGWVTFQHKPEPGGLTARPLGYARP